MLPFHCSNCSPLVAGNLLFLVTGNGIDDKTDIMHDARAPSFLALTRRPANSPGEQSAGRPGLRRTMVQSRLCRHPGQTAGHFSRRRRGPVQLRARNGQAHLGVSLLSKKAAKPGAKVDNYFVATPVIHDNKVYIGMGVYAGNMRQPPRFSYFLCVDAGRTGDVSPAALRSARRCRARTAPCCGVTAALMSRPGKTERPVNFEHHHQHLCRARRPGLHSGGGGLHALPRCRDGPELVDV